ncbi:MAG TPA: PRC-barrel domain-containing protein [Planctomycetota bacterium]|nr:PRC-barrel domain-containing protein [Planctomycetota bacterium]
MQWRSGLAVAAALMGLAALAPAQDEPIKPVPVEVREIVLVQPIGDLIGIKVQNAAGQDLGKVEDLVVQPEGDITFAVMAFDAKLRNDAKLVPIPWLLVNLMPEKGIVQVQIKPERLIEAPGFARANWPDMHKANVFQDAREYFAAERTDAGAAVLASAKRDRPIVVFRGSELRGYAVQNAKGEKLGDIREIAVDPSAARLNFFVLSVGSVLSEGAKSIAVPWAALELKPDPDNPQINRLMLATDKEKLMAAPVFEAPGGSWTEVANPKWIGTVYHYFEVEPYWKTRK